MLTVPTLDVREVSGSADTRRDFARALGDAFAEVGFVRLTGHGIDAGITTPAYDALKRFFALPLATKERYHVPGGAGARGYTHYRVETAKDAHDPDLKEFWHVGRELPTGTPRPLSMPPNLWPAEVPDFRDAMWSLYRALDELGSKVLQGLALYLDLPEGYFRERTQLGNSVLRPIHYPPLHEGEVSGVRSAAHEDINLITLLIGSGEPGLEIKLRNGRWLPVHTAPGTVVCNVGDMLQRLTNHRLVSTTHRVVNPPEPWASRPRYALPFFLHPNSDMLLASLPSCVGPDNPDRYPNPITADGYLRERLAEIRLL